jgi:hypothetical protein
MTTTTVVPGTDSSTPTEVPLPPIDTFSHPSERTVADRLPSLGSETMSRSRGREKVLFAEVSTDKIFARLDELERGNEDVVVTYLNFNYCDDGTLKIGDEKFSFTEYSFSQLATLIGFPAKTLQKSPLGTGRASRQAIVAHWIEQQEGRSYLVRLKRSEALQKDSPVVGRIRGILPALPNGALPYSNRELLQDMLPYLRTYNMGVQMGAANEHSFHIRALFREELNVGAKTGGRDMEIDRHSLGVHFVNSEVGKFSLRADLMVYRQICKNGMVAQSERSGLLHKAHRFIDKTTIGSEIQQAMEAVRSRQDELIQGLRSLRDQHLQNPEDDIRAFLREHKAPKEWIEFALQAYTQERLGTRFGVLQAMTRAAQKVVPDLRIEFEAIAGQYAFKYALPG